MSDREKVIKGLECCLGANDCDVEPNEDCPYKGQCLCAMALRYDVLGLLKEQEAVKPKIDAFGHPYCPKCKILVYETWEFCPHCGQAVKWE